MELKLKLTEEEEEASPLLPFPLSLAFPIPNFVEEGGPMLPSRRVTKPCRFGSLLRYYHDCVAFVLVVSITTQLLFWCVHCPQKNNVFIMLQSNVTQFLRVIRSKGLKEKEKERGDEMVSLAELPLEVWGELRKYLMSCLHGVPVLPVCKQFSTEHSTPLIFVTGRLHLPTSLIPSLTTTHPKIGETIKGIERKGETKMVDWTELPLELWGEVGKRLVSRVDLVHFRSVSKPWRSSLPFPTRFPIQVPMPPDHSDLPVNNVPYFITEANIYWVNVGSKTKPQHVLMEFEEVDQGNNFCIHTYAPNLISAMPDKHRGPQLSFVAKAYRLHMALPVFKSREDRYEGKWSFVRARLRVSKIVLIYSSNVDGGVDHASHAPSSHLSVVALLKRGGKLALLRLGGSQDPNWDWDTGFCTHVIYEIATYRGQLCAIDCTGRAFLMDYDSLHMTQVAAAAPLPVNLESMLLRLFEAPLEVYLVTLVKLEGKPKVDVNVYKLSVGLGKWVEVDDTGDQQVFFRGRGFDVCIPRDVVTSDNYGSWMLKHKGLDDFRQSSLLLAQDRMDADDARYCFIGFRMRHIPWFLRQEAASTASSTAFILSQYENSIVGRTNYLNLIRGLL